MALPEEARDRLENRLILVIAVIALITLIFDLFVWRA
jgi:hypothetical protein